MPQNLNYQAIVRDASGQVLGSTAVSYRFSIIKGTPSGTAVYVEKHGATTSQLGLVTLAIGNGTDKTGDFTSIDWGADKYFLRVEIDASGGTNYVEMGVTQLLSVPYALHAKTAETAIDAVNKTYADALKAQIKAIEDYLVNTGSYRLFDAEGNQYKVVKIGTQLWMAENLRTTIYNDGTSITPVTDNVEWSGLAAGAFCWYYNLEAMYRSTYGGLYNWHAVNTAKLCPAGWHVPTDAEWTILTDYLGGENTAGDKLKETGSTHWGSTNIATNETGFTALPGGRRTEYGVFSSYSEIIGYWWTSSENSGFPTKAWYRRIFKDNGAVESSDFSKKCGFSVRCLRD